MRTRIFIAVFLFLIGIAPMIDWWIFCSRPEVKDLEWEAFKSAYIAHLPEYLQPLWTGSLPLSTLISMWTLTIAAILFFKQGSKFFKVVAAISFLLAFWNLFSLM